MTKKTPKRIGKEKSKNPKILPKKNNKNNFISKTQKLRNLYRKTEKEKPKGKY